MGGRELSGTLAWGYIPAAAAAFIWATYSLMTKRVTAFPTTAIGLFGLVSGALSLLCHVLLEPSVTLQARDWACWPCWAWARWAARFTCGTRP